MCYNPKKYSGDDNMKKLFLIVILVITTVSCSLLDSEEWNEARERREERGVHCYKQYGNVYCKDRDGNRVY